MIEESKNILESIKQGLQDIVVSEVREIKSEIRHLDDKMDNGFARLDGKIDSLRNELKAEIHRLGDNVGKRMDSMDRHLDEAFNVRERLAVLEARVASR